MKRSLYVGKMVHYVSYGTPNGEYAPACRAAVVTAFDERYPENLDLCVLNPSGLFFNRSVVYDPLKAAGTWHWPNKRREECE